MLERLAVFMCRNVGLSMVKSGVAAGGGLDVKLFKTDNCFTNPWLDNSFPWGDTFQYHTWQVAQVTASIQVAALKDFDLTVQNPFLWIDFDPNCPPMPARTWASICRDQLWSHRTSNLSRAARWVGIDGWVQFATERTFRHATTLHPSTCVRRQQHPMTGITSKHIWPTLMPGATLHCVATSLLGRAVTDRQTTNFYLWGHFDIL